MVSQVPPTESGRPVVIGSARFGGRWLDTAGRPIHAHGGSILAHAGVYYWYGEDRNGPTLPSVGCEYRTDVIGISCYSSRDLEQWTFEGHVLSAVATVGHDLHPSRVVERPRVLYNRTTREFVMWLHIDVEDYSFARAGVAVSDSPTGPFRYLGSLWPNGADSRDLTLFQDADGSAYLVHASDWNHSLHIARLDHTYRDVTGEYVRALVDQSREAPIVLRTPSGYHMITSACTGWQPNSALDASAPAMLGRWELKDRVCEGPGAPTTFGSQGTHAFALGDGGPFVFMADLWVPEDLAASTYLWLPIEVDDQDRLTVRWEGEPGSDGPITVG